MRNLNNIINQIDGWVDETENNNIELKKMNDRLGIKRK